MNLYLISQNRNNDYDTYDSAVVAAESEEKARMIRPDNVSWEYIESQRDYCWTKAEYVTVKYLGIVKNKSIKEGVILASFNAG